jgi:hypothetical protein
VLSGAKGTLYDDSNYLKLLVRNSQGSTDKATTVNPALNSQDDSSQFEASAHRSYLSQTLTTQDDSSQSSVLTVLVTSRTVRTVRLVTSTRVSTGDEAREEIFNLMIKTNASSIP